MKRGGVSVWALGLCRLGMVAASFHAALTDSSVRAVLTDSSFHSALMESYGSIDSMIASTDAALMEGYDQKWFNHDYVAPGLNDSRSPCPALNALANHGYMKHSGKGINLAEIILALFFGLGVSPELSAIIMVFGLLSSRNELSFKLDLADLGRHGYGIEHDCSFSRNDAAVGDNNKFNPEIWEVAAKELSKSKIINPLRFGRAKAARVKDAKLRNPKTVYGPKAWFNGFAEVGLIMSAFGIVPGLARWDIIKYVFEEERLPYHLGWRPKPFFTNTPVVLVVGAASILGDNNAFGTIGSVVLREPGEILNTFLPPSLDHLPELEKLLKRLGFNPKPLKVIGEIMKKLAKKKNPITEEEKASGDNFHGGTATGNFEAAGIDYGKDIKLGSNAGVGNAESYGSYSGNYGDYGNGDYGNGNGGNGGNDNYGGNNGNGGSGGNYGNNGGGYGNNGGSYGGGSSGGGSYGGGNSGGGSYGGGNSGGGSYGSGNSGGGSYGGGGGGGY